MPMEETVVSLIRMIRFQERVVVMEEMEDEPWTMPTLVEEMLVTAMQLTVFVVRE